MKELWITNVSKCDIHLSDLNIVVKSMKSFNLFGKTNITREQVIKSCLSGSISKKKGYLFIRFSSPKIEKPRIEKINSKLNDRTKTCLIFNKKEIEDINNLYKEDYLNEDDMIINDLLNGEE